MRGSQNLLKFRIGMVLLSVTLPSVSACSADEFSQSRCLTYGSDVAMIVFKSASGKTRSVSFSATARFSAINPGYGPEFATDWKNINSFVANRRPSNKYMLSIVFVDGSGLGPSPMELGVLNKECLDTIVGSVGGEIRIVVK
jgi:hypothetical protein